MTDKDALVESIIDKQFDNEPLAQAIMFYLNEDNPGAYSKIVALFEQIMKRKIECSIKDEQENDDASREHAIDFVGPNED